ncbi:acyl carrier protein [Elizabethkingia argentiflava]|uniref:Acyl carrier protein n=1 Tax=Elizabethkingia argenteiflava TaxID=2681556 RepID=A0A845Q0A0_9FLAO|nr:acyl carrier protein [Elizabethkingia argenteiflava]NAW51750.1 acyl carrier protein [Elizabethkingia argenteiflava]
MEHQVKEIMAYVFNMPVHKLKGELNTDTIDNWDSLSHLSLIVELESAFNITFTPQEIEDFKSLDKILSGIKDKISLRETNTES